MATLNAGCGTDGWGDVRLDVERHSKTIYLARTSANIIGSVENLPFKDHVFVEVHSFHVLEHVGKPQQAFDELMRVTEKKLVVRVPVWHLYSILIEVLALFHAFVRIRRVGVQTWLDAIKKVSRWKQRYSTHDWYIRFRKANVNRIYGMPAEYEWIGPESVSD